MPEAKIGVIGGTGLYAMDGLTAIEELDIDTPFGKPSDKIIVGKLGEKGIAFLPRHGAGHRILPSELPSKANIYALKSLGVEHIIAVNSCGSFKEEIQPGDLVIPDQVIDRTRNRSSTFFGEGVVAHISYADPFCLELSRILYQSAREVGINAHSHGTFIAMEGPAFSTRAESRLYRSWGADIIGMTVLPEAKLAREAEICYASIAHVTDYDSWMERSEAVTVDVILKALREGVESTRKIIRLAVNRLPDERTCGCATALQNAIVTEPGRIPEAQKQKLNLLIGKYIH